MDFQQISILTMGIGLIILHLIIYTILEQKLIQLSRRLSKNIK